MLSTRSRQGFIALLSLMFLPVPRNVFAQQPSAPLTSAGRPDAATGPRVVNTLPAYLAFWDEAGSKDEATQIRLFRQSVLEAHPELFTDNIVDLGQKKGVEEEDRRIGSYLKQVRPLVPAIRILNGRLQQDLATYVQGFVQVFLITTPPRRSTSRFRSDSLMVLPARSVDTRHYCSEWM